MVETYLLAILVVGIFFISISIIQLKKQKIKQVTFVIWSALGVLAIIIAVVPFSISIFRSLLGTELSVSALLGTSTLFLAIIVFYLHQKVDGINQRITKLVTELGFDKYYKDRNFKGK